MRGRFLHLLLLLQRTVLSIILAAAILGCARDIDTEAGDWQAVTETEGNVTTVRTVSGSVWRGRASLVEDASIGVRDGDDPYILGELSGIAAIGKRIYVLDWSTPVLRMYDNEGRYIKDIGGAGGGPGEFRMPWSLNVDPAAGRIYVRDDVQMRINVYSADGEILDHIQLSYGFMTTAPMVIPGGGNVYTPIVIRDESGPLDAMAGYTPEGVAVDTILAPVMDYEPPLLEYLDDEGEPFTTEVPFSPEALWAVTPDLKVVSGLADEYRFEIRGRDGKVTVVERDVEPVPLNPNEKDWYRRRQVAQIRRTDPDWIWRGESIPDAKPFYDSFIPDRTGRIWVLRKDEGIYLEDCNEEAETYSEFRDSPCWMQSYRFDVFETSGRFLGSVRAPDGIRTYPEPFIDGNKLLIHLRDNEGVPYVKRYRLVSPE